MSRAFTKNDSSEAPLVVPQRAPLPAGVPNYVTARGLSALRSELETLLSERAIAEANRDDPELSRTLATLGARIAELEARLGSAVLVDPTEQQRDEVRFGAKVTVRIDGEQVRRYQIVGIDEANVAEGRVAFVAPVARALLGKSVGEVVTVRAPRGEEELEILAIEYESN